MPSESGPLGTLIPTSYIWDVSLIEQIDVTSPEFKELLVRLHQYINDMALAINLKDTGVYDVEEHVNGQGFFPVDPNIQDSETYRGVYRKVVYYPTALPNAGTVNIPHDITLNVACTFTRIYGVANDIASGSYLPLPYASPTAANNIELSVNGTNVTITTGSDRTAYTQNYIILEFIDTL